MDNELSNNGYTNQEEKMASITEEAWLCVSRFFNDDTLKDKVINKWENNEAMILESREDYINAYEAFKKHAPYWVSSLYYYDWEDLEPEEKSPFQDWGYYIKPLKDFNLLFDLVVVGGVLKRFIKT
ncbi:hypothetical protein BZK19_00560 [Helicobacter pylori]|nr:hypothetical protein BZK19_00560 [Helicobacter pylori]WQU36500.1 hypothetical protein KVD82_00995 [Helicobacter pylori]WQU37948.1 hypothetical protein KVC64_01005 [Helicobacter pylori]